MKTAICFTGNGRSIFSREGNYVFNNLLKNTIDCWEDRDVYYILGDDDNERTEKIRELCSTVDNMNLVVTSQEDLDLTNVEFINPNQNKETKPNNQSLGKFLNKRRLLGETLDKCGKIYDRVVISRDDVLYSKPITDDVRDLDLNKIWIPNWGHHAGGYNDRFCVTNHKLALTYCEMWNHRHEVKRIHIESFFRYNMDKYIGVDNIGMFYIDFKRIRPSGIIDRADNNLMSQAPYPNNRDKWKTFLFDSK